MTGTLTPNQPGYVNLDSNNAPVLPAQQNPAPLGSIKAPVMGHPLLDQLGRPYSSPPDYATTTGAPVTNSMTPWPILFDAAFLARNPQPGTVIPPVGGYAPGDAGAVGSIYEGFTLSYANDFLSLDLVGPSAPRGKFFPTVVYGGGPRGTNAGIRGTGWEADPFGWGYNDSGRGVSPAFNNVTQSGSSVKVAARKATAAEQAHFGPTDPTINGGVRPQVTGMLACAGAFGFYPAVGGAVIVEIRARYSAKATNPAGFHPSFWTYTDQPVAGTTGNEWDMEGTSQNFGARYNEHTAGSISASGGFGSAIDTMDGTNFHTYTWIFTPGAQTRLYLDGVQIAGQATGAGTDANSKSLPSSVLLTSHIYNGTFGSDVYSQAAWDSSVTGAWAEYDWIRCWRTTGKSHYTPQVAVADVNVAYNGTANIVLPSALTLWGDASVTEYVQVIPYDGMEPGMDYNTTFVQFPAGVTYTPGTRTIAVDFSAGTGKAGRMHFAVKGYKPDGSTYEPLRFAVNRAPAIATPNQSLTIGSAYSRDVYVDCDCGVLLPKTISVSGLPDGLTFNPSTGMISGTPITVQSAPVTVQCTNSLGQVSNSNVTFSVGAGNVVGALIDHTEVNTANTVFTSNTLNFAATDRLSVHVHARESGIATSPTATAVLNKTGGGTVTGNIVGVIRNMNANFDVVYIFDFPPTGVTSGTITTTWNVSMLRCGFISWKVSGAANVVPSGAAAAFDNVSNGTGFQGTCNVTVPANGIAFGSQSIVSSVAPTAAWTNMTADIGATVVGSTMYYSGAHDYSGVSGANSYTGKFNGTSSPINYVMGAVAYGP